MTRNEQPQTVTLSEVDKVYPMGIPLVYQDGQPTKVSIEEFHQRDLEQRVTQRLFNTFKAIRKREGPQTALHALMLVETATLGQIAGIAHVDPRELEPELDVLTKSGWVTTSGVGESRLTEYRFTEPIEY